MNPSKKRVAVLIGIIILRAYLMDAVHEERRFSFEVSQDVPLEDGWLDDAVESLEMNDYDAICDRSTVIAPSPWWQRLVLYTYGKWCFYKSYCSEQYSAVKKYVYRSYCYGCAQILRFKRK
jgi:hypothetical protein